MSKKATRAARRSRARQLRAEGKSLSQIAAALNVSKSQAARDVAAPKGRVPANPAGPANQRAVRHGAQSPALIEPHAVELIPAIFEHNGHLDRHRDHQAVHAYAVNLARVQRILGWLAQQEDEVFSDTDTGEIHRVYGRLERFERQARDAERELGISPLARSKMRIRIEREPHEVLEAYTEAQGYGEETNGESDDE